MCDEPRDAHGRPIRGQLIDPNVPTPKIVDVAPPPTSAPPHGYATGGTVPAGIRFMIGPDDGPIMPIRPTPGQRETLRRAEVGTTQFDDVGHDGFMRRRLFIVWSAEMSSRVVVARWWRPRSPGRARRRERVWATQVGDRFVWHGVADCTKH